MLGIKWDHKLQMWVVFVKATGKVVYKNENKDMAYKALESLRLSGEEDRIKKRNYH